MYSSGFDAKTCCKTRTFTKTPSSLPQILIWNHVKLLIARTNHWLSCTELDHHDHNHKKEFDSIEESETPFLKSCTRHWGKRWIDQKRRWDIVLDWFPFVLLYRNLNQMLEFILNEDSQRITLQRFSIINIRSSN